MKKVSKFLLPALLVTSAMSVARYHYIVNKVNIDYSAFRNLSNNLSEISSSAISSASADDTLVTKEIISTIEKEINKSIAHVKYAKHHSKNKKEKIEIQGMHIAENISEINNGDQVQLKTIETEKKAFNKFDQTVIDAVTVNNSSTISVENSNGPIEPRKEIKDEVEADMPMFEYSSKEKAENTKDLYDRTLSPTVKEAISRASGNILRKNPLTIDETIKESNNESYNDSQIMFDYTKEKKNRGKVEKNEGFTSNITMSNYGLKVSHLDIENGRSEEIKSFNFTPDYNREERIDSSAAGIVTMQYELSGNVNTQTGIIEANGMMNTRVEVNLNTQGEALIPMISLDAAEKLYASKNIILLAITSDVRDVEINESYSEKILLDVNAKKTDNLDQVHFVLFSGMRSGNVLLKYLLKNQETAQKIIYVGEKEMYFESADFIEGSRELFTFKTHQLMSEKSASLTINPELISVLNSGTKAKKHTLNTYELKMPAMVNNTRKYLEMKHLESSLFIGADDKMEIDVPSGEFISSVLKANQLNELRENCIVQLNVSKELAAFEANGKNQTGEMYTETTYLDDEGNFSKDDFESAGKVFLVGDMEGIFNAKLEYSNGSTQFIKTYCSPGSYIVEQL